MASAQRFDNQRSEQVVQSVIGALEHLALGAIIFDANQNNIYFNAAASLIFRDSAASMRDPVGNSLAGEALQSHLRALHEILQHDTKTARLTLRTSEGFRGASWLEINYSSFQSETRPGRTLGLLLIQDASHQRCIETDRSALLGLAAEDMQNLRQLRTLQQQSVAQQKRNESFVLTLAHDLRNPLAIAQAGIALLQCENLTNDARSDISLGINRSIRRLEGMIRDLLDANRMNSGAEFPINRKRSDLRRILQQTVDSFAVAYVARFKLPAGEPIWGQFCENGIQRVIENLLDNAVKYGEAETPITVSAEVSGAIAVVSVHNEGADLSALELESIFIPFRQIRPNVSGPGKGWGIGLALVSGIINAHGGTVHAESGSGKGVTLVIKIPLNSAAAAEGDRPSQPTAALKSGTTLA